MTTGKATYERLRPMIVWLGLAELAWLTYWLLSVDDAAPAYVGTVVFWIAGMVVWLGLVIRAGMRGLFLKHTRYFSNMVGLAIVITFAGLMFGFLPIARHGLMVAAQNTSDVQLAAIHILRLLAIGSVIKYLHGELPLHFLILGSFPDVLFAISAVAVTVTGADGAFDPQFLMIWHVTGLSLFLGAGVSMFFSVPSPLRIYHAQPDASIVFMFPMVLAPTFTVPLFMLAHVFALVKLLAASPG